MQFLDVQVQKEVKGSLRAVLVSPVVTLSSSLSQHLLPPCRRPLIFSLAPKSQNLSPQPPLPRADRHRLGGHLRRLLSGVELFQDVYEQLQDIDCVPPGAKQLPQGQIGSAGPRDSDVQ